MARLPERPAEVVLRSEPELIIRLLERSLKSLHYLFVLFFFPKSFPGRLAEEDHRVHLVGVGASVGGRVREMFPLII